MFIVRLVGVVDAHNFAERSFNPRVCHVPTRTIIDSYLITQCLEKSKEIEYLKYRETDENLNFGPNIHNF